MTCETVAIRQDDLRRFPLPEGVDDNDLNKEQLARALKVSVNTVDKWVMDGMPVVQDGTNGRAYVLRLSECWAWRQAREAEASAQMEAAERSVQAMRLELIGGALGDTEQALSPKERKEIYAAEHAYMMAARARGELVHLAEVQELLEVILSAVRDGSDALADRLARDCGLEGEIIEHVVVICDDMLKDIRSKIEERALAHSEGEMPA